MALQGKDGAGVRHVSVLQQRTTSFPDSRLSKGAFVARRRDFHPVTLPDKQLGGVEV